MYNLLKMECYKLRTSKLFIVMLSVACGLNFIAEILTPMILKLAEPAAVLQDEKFSSIIATPLSGGLMIFMFISVASYYYSDFDSGYIKNIAGQVKNKGSIVIVKFITAAIHNLIFFICGGLAITAGAAINGMLVFDKDIPGGIATMLIKWLLSIALCSILLFFAVGIRSKSLTIVFGVIFAVSALSLLYMGINAGIAALIKGSTFDLASYMPDALLDSVNVVNGDLVPNALIVGVVYTVVFTSLTYTTFKKRDI